MGIQSEDRNYQTISIMKLFLLSLLLSSVLASSLNRNEECPTLEQIGEAFENEFNAEIPEGILNCFHGGENCPFGSFEDFFHWFEETTGLEIPELDIDLEEMVAACKADSENCPTLEEVVNFIQNDLGIDMDDELVQVLYDCAEEILSKLGWL